MSVYFGQHNSHDTVRSTISRIADSLSETGYAVSKSSLFFVN